MYDIFFKLIQSTIPLTIATKSKKNIYDRHIVFAFFKSKRTIGITTIAPTIIKVKSIFFNIILIFLFHLISGMNKLFFI